MMAAAKRASLRPLRALLLVPAAAAAGCQSSGSATCGLAHVADLPLVLANHALYTRIQLNGQPVVMQFDTGAAENIVSKSAAGRLGMTVTISGRDVMMGIGGSREVGSALAHEVDIGGMKAQKMRFYTLPDEQMRPGAEGVLGMQYLPAFDIDLDAWNKRIGLYKTTGNCSAPQAPLAQPLYSVDALDNSRNDDAASSIEDLGPHLAVLINGARLEAEIDTGAFRTTVFRDSARRAGLLGVNQAEGEELTGSGEHRIKATERKIAQLTIGELTLSNAPVLVADQRHPEHTDMLLGYDLITRIHFWISRSSHTIIMQYPPQATATSP